MGSDDTANRVTRAGTAMLAAVALALAIGSVALTRSVGWAFSEAVDAFVVSNLVIGLGFAWCGAFIAWHRPGNPVGWLYAGGGSLQLVSALCAPLAQAMQEAGADRGAVRIVMTVFAWAWPINIGAALPLSLLLLPSGYLPSPRWRPLALAVVVTSPLFVLEVATTSGPPMAGLPMAWWVLPQTGGWATLWRVSEIRWLASIVLGLAALVWRYRRGSEMVRRQLLWILAAAGTIVVAIAPWALIAGTPVVVLFAIPLLPIAIATAIVRYGLLDIRLVLARGLSYLLLSALVLSGYVLLVLALSGLASALIVALLAFPLRARLQRAAEQLVYGDRDPLRLASRVGERLLDLPGSLAEIRSALRLPFVAIVIGSEMVAVAGERPDRVERRPLRDGADLLVGLRSGEVALGRRDQQLLDLLAGPLGVALHATLVSRDLQQSRGRLVAAREEERLRLGRDLHDGLGPMLTGVALAADAVANLQYRDPVQARALLVGVRADTRRAIAEVRRVVQDLRPAALTELGLVGALQARAAQTSRRADGSELQVSVDAAISALPAAVEVAAYRIATEALNNAVRHSVAATVRLRLWQDPDLNVEILDDGAVTGMWSPGVGVTAMRERAEELGGVCEAGPSLTGGAVRARLPVGPAMIFPRTVLPVGPA